MALVGSFGLMAAFVFAIASLCCLAAAHVLGGVGARRAADGCIEGDAAKSLAHTGRRAAVAGAVALAVCCGVLVFCFMTGDTSLAYVLQYRSDASDGLAWLYRLAGLWAGRAGSLLFWAWLIAVFCAVMALRDAKRPHALDTVALAVMQLVLAAFVGACLFSEGGTPFAPTPSQHFDAWGNLQGAATSWGMSTLLEHWAMAIHPPTLFVGYAGLTVPFAYAIAALVIDDPSKEWVERSTRYALFSWLFLGIGIGLGSVWAYVVLGWGGYWGWDPVENASLLSWLVGVVLIHGFTVYRQRGAFRRWSVMCACLAFAFVIVGTLIARSGIVQSVHAFEDDPVSLALFGSLAVLPMLAGVVGLAVRWRSFGPAESGADAVESFASKDAAYYFNNVIMVAFALMLAYMTVSSALPSWLPFGGQSLPASSYNLIARPLGIVYLAILAVCPLLSWGRTDGALFWRRARVPGACALALFAALMAYFVFELLPVYDGNVAYYAAQAGEGSEKALQALMQMQPAWYYLGLTVAGFFVASLLFFNALFMLMRGIGRWAKAHGATVFAAAVGVFRGHAATYGGFVAHLAMAVILVGLIGSSMYVTERTGYLPSDEKADAATEAFAVGEYELRYAGDSIDVAENGDDVFYRLDFDVVRDGEVVGHASPSVQMVQSTQQQKLNASVLSFPTEDLFVVYHGANDEGDFSLDVRVNPLISLVWVGFGLLMVGTALAFAGRRHPCGKVGGDFAAAVPVEEEE